MIIIDTPLRKKFALLEKGLQKILLKDLGFLTLETEYDQLQFVEKVLDLSVPRREVFRKKMAEKQKSKSYLLNVKKFKDEYETTVLPLFKKAINKDATRKEDEDRKKAEKKLKESLKDL